MKKSFILSAHLSYFDKGINEYMFTFFSRIRKQSITLCVCGFLQLLSDLVTFTEKSLIKNFIICAVR